jgi:2-haloacid dehalogenase
LRHRFNETLLDVGALEPHFKQAFGDGRVLQGWFANVLLYSEVATLAGPYADFASIGGGLRHGRECSRDHAASYRPYSHPPGHATLPAHPDVRDGLQTTRDAGLRLVTLTNSAPAEEAYQSVADSLGLPIDRLRLVAAHAWDIVGALRAGCAAAFVARPGKVLYPLGPSRTSRDRIRSVAQQIVAAESRQA